MRAGLVVFGIIILVGTFFFTQIFISPQERQQIELANKLCNTNVYGIPVGQIGQAISGQAADQCNQAGNISQLMSLSPFGYGIGFLLLVVGLALGGSQSKSKASQERKDVEEGHKCDVCGKAYHSLKEVGKCEARHDFEKEEKEHVQDEPPTPKPKAKFCTKCGNKIREGAQFCMKCGKGT